MARILVAEPNPTMRLAIRRMIAGMGYETDDAGSAEAALAQIEHQRPDVVVIDAGIVAADGTSLRELLRARPELATLPQIVLVGVGTAPPEIDPDRTPRDAVINKQLQLPQIPGKVQIMLHELERLRAAVVQTKAEPQPPRRLAIVGAKGGVGVSTVAANVAVAAARAVRAPLLVETAWFRGTLHNILGLPAVGRLDELPLESPEALTAAIVSARMIHHSSGVRVLFGPVQNQAPPRPPVVLALLEALSTLGELSIIDLGSMLDSWGQIASRIADEVWVVSTADPASLERAAAAVELLRGWRKSSDRIRIIVNGFGATQRLDPFELGAQLGADVTGMIPIDEEDDGLAVERRPDGPTARALRELTSTIIRSELRNALEARPHPSTSIAASASDEELSARESDFPFGGGFDPFETNGADFAGFGSSNPAPSVTPSGEPPSLIGVLSGFTARRSER